MLRSLRRVVLGVTACALAVLGGGCAGPRAVAPSPNDLSPPILGARIVVMPPEVDLSRALRRTPGLGQPAEYVRRRSRLTFEKALAQAGYRVIPYDRVEALRRAGAGAHLEAP